MVRKGLRDVSCLEHSLQLYTYIVCEYGEKKVDCTKAIKFTLHELEYCNKVNIIVQMNIPQTLSITCFYFRYFATI